MVWMCCFGADRQWRRSVWNMRGVSATAGWCQDFDRRQHVAYVPITRDAWVVILFVPVCMKETEPDHQATPEEGMKYDTLSADRRFAIPSHQIVLPVCGHRGVDKVHTPIQHAD